MSTPILDEFRLDARRQLHPLRLDWQSPYRDGFYSAACTCGTSMVNYTMGMLAAGEQAHRLRAVVRGFASCCGRVGAKGGGSP